MTGGDCGEGTGWGLGKEGWASHLSSDEALGKGTALGGPKEAESALVGHNRPLPTPSRNTCGHHERLEPHFLHSLIVGGGLPSDPSLPPHGSPRWGAVPPGLVTRGGNSSHAGGGGAGQVGLPGSPRAACEDTSMVSAGGFSLLGPEGLLLLGHPPQPPLLAARTPPKLNPYLFGAPTLGPRSSARWQSGGAGHPWQSGRCSAGA